MRRKVSMKDIAQELGVSTALVSYVLNNQHEGRINKDTAEKIRKLAAELNYQPNQIAKSLKSSKSNTIGLIVADISNPFSASLARIIEDEAKKSKYTVIFGSADESYKKSQDLITFLLNRQVDGFIIAPAEDSEKQLIALKKQGIPFVLIDRYFPELDVDRVVLNNFQAAYDAVSHLISNGYHNIGMINFKTKLFHLEERVRGFNEALRDQNIKNPQDNFIMVEEKEIKTEVKVCIDQMLNKKEPINALFFGSNNLALEGLAYIRSLNIKVPEELAVVCFDEDIAYNLFHCPLTYVKQPLVEMGKKSVETLLNSIQEGSKNTSIILEAELMVHESSIRK
jgi:LacI family transcriptional regulator